MGKFANKDANLSRQSPHRLRSEEKEAVEIRKPGPKLKKFSYLSRVAKTARLGTRARVQHIVIGFGTGRCGTSNMAANLDSFNGSAAVTHERGNTCSLDHGKGFTDKFCIAAWSA